MQWQYRLDCVITVWYYEPRVFYTSTLTVSDGLWSNYSANEFKSVDAMWQKIKKSCNVLNRIWIQCITLFTLHQFSCSRLDGTFSDSVHSDHKLIESVEADEHWDNAVSLFSQLYLELHILLNTH